MLLHDPTVSPLDSASAQQSGEISASMKIFLVVSINILRARTIFNLRGETDRGFQNSHTKAAWNPPLETASPCLVSLEAKTLHKGTEWQNLSILNQSEARSLSEREHGALGPVLHAPHIVPFGSQRVQHRRHPPVPTCRCGCYAYLCRAWLGGSQKGDVYCVIGGRVQL